MEVTKQQVDQLEKELKGVQDTLNKEVLPLLNRIVRGLDGDKENQTEGLIRGMQRMQDEIKELQKRQALSDKKDEDQDIAINAKNSLKNDAANWGQRIVGWIIQGIVIYAIIKGVIGADALLK